MVQYPCSILSCCSIIYKGLSNGPYPPDLTSYQSFQLRLLLPAKCSVYYLQTWVVFVNYFVLYIFCSVFLCVFPPCDHFLFQEVKQPVIRVKGTLLSATKILYIMRVELSRGLLKTYPNEPRLRSEARVVSQYAKVHESFVCLSDTPSQSRVPGNFRCTLHPQCQEKEETVLRLRVI